MRCPNCGNENCQIITETSSTGKDFSVGKGFCGALLFGPIGILCGACGEGKQIHSKNYWVCPNSNRKFKI